MSNKETLDKIASALVTTRHIRLSLAELLQMKFRTWAENTDGLSELRKSLTSTGIDLVYGEPATARYGKELAAAFEKTIPNRPWFAFWRAGAMHKQAIEDVVQAFATAIKKPFLPFESFKPGQDSYLRKTLILALQSPDEYSNRYTVSLGLLRHEPWDSSWKDGAGLLYMLHQTESALQKALECLPTHIPSPAIAAEHPGLDAVVLWSMPRPTAQQLAASKQRRQQYQAGIAQPRLRHNHPYAEWDLYYMDTDDLVLNILGLSALDELSENETYQPEAGDTDAAWSNDSAEGSGMTAPDTNTEDSRRSAVDTSVVVDSAGDYHTSLGAMS